eukprot:810444_1
MIFRGINHSHNKVYRRFWRSISSHYADSNVAFTFPMSCRSLVSHLTKSISHPQHHAGITDPRLLTMPPLMYFPHASTNNHPVSVSECPEPRAYAAVLLLLRAIDARPTLVVVRRAPVMRRHAGQLALPGGLFDASRDRCMMDTAVRETKEEIGVCLHNHSLNVVGALDRSFMSERSLIQVEAYVGITECVDLPYVLQACEVQHCLEVPLEVLCDAKNYDSNGSFYDNEIKQIWNGPTFRIIEHGEPTVIWGLTARIIAYFLKSISHENT